MRRYTISLVLLAFPGMVGAQNIVDGDSLDPLVALTSPALPVLKPITAP